jgi:hypothetical protein
MLEYIVRPFQAPSAHGTIIIPSTPTPSTDTAILTWGGEATLPAVQFIELGFNTKKGREDFNEKNRDSETVRIMGQSPDDDSPSYIDVARSNKLYLDKKTSQDMNASDAGQTGYVDISNTQEGQLLGSMGATPSQLTKATIKLNNNTAAGG